MKSETTKIERIYNFNKTYYYIILNNKRNLIKDLITNIILYCLVFEYEFFFMLF